MVTNTLFNLFLLKDPKKYKVLVVKKSIVEGSKPITNQIAVPDVVH